MSENTNIEINEEELIKNSPFSDTIKVKRNNIEEALVPIVGTRSAWKGIVYAAPQCEDNEIEIEKDHRFLSFLKWLGKTNVVTMLNTWLRRTGQDYQINATGKKGTEEEGKLNIPRLIECWEKLTAAGQKMGEMQEQIEKEQNAFTAYVTGKFMDEYAQATDEEKALLKASVEARRSRIANLKFALEQRKAAYSKEENTDEVRAS